MYVLTNEERESLQEIKKGSPGRIPKAHLAKFLQLELIEERDGILQVTGEGWMYLAMTRKKAYIAREHTSKPPTGSK